MFDAYDDPPYRRAPSAYDTCLLHAVDGRHADLPGVAPLHDADTGRQRRGRRVHEVKRRARAYPSRPSRCLAITIRCTWFVPS